MIAIAERVAQVPVPAGEYMRLLGYPRGATLEGRALELARWAQAWYAAHGRPWMYGAAACDVALRTGASVRIDDADFSSPRLHRRLERAGAHAVVLAAVSAGPELEEEARRRWEAACPDEYFFLEMYGSAVVEQLVVEVGARLCAAAEREQMAVLPHESPGYDEWSVADQPRLLELLKRRARSEASTPDIPLDALDSGMLRPKKSLVAVFGLTRHVDRVRRLTEIRPCDNCSFTPCGYRRAPYIGGSGSSGGSGVPGFRGSGSEVREVAYSVNRRALKKWTGERLSVHRRADGTIAAAFRYDGTTCTNAGRALAFCYDVVLGPAADGFPILEQRCAPAPDDTGHQAMCRYLTERDALLTAIAREQPLRGRPLADVLTWARPSSPAGCFCEAEAREHKWGLVLETIHYALTQEQA